MTIVQESLVTIYSDAMAFMLVLGLAILAHRIRRDRTEGHIFLALCFSVMVDAVGSAFAYAMHYQPYAGYSIIEWAAKSLMEIAELHFMFQWLIYVDYKLYGDRERLQNNYTIIFIPLVIFDFLLLINPFTGAIFTLTNNLWYNYTWIFYVMEWFKFGYFMLSVIIIVLYRIRNGSLLFLHAEAMWIPLLFGGVVSMLTSYSAVPLGCAIGLINLYFSMMEVWQYSDNDSDYYNEEFLSRLEEMAPIGKLKYHSAVIFEINTGDVNFAEVIKTALPNKKAIVHLDKGKFILFSENRKQTYLDILINKVKEVADDYDAKNPMAPFNMKTSSWVERDNCDAVTFIQNVRKNVG